MSSTGDDYLEIRTYKLVAGSRAEVDRMFRDGVVPMLHRHGVTVVAARPALQDDDHYVLLRAFPSLDRRAEQLRGFYGSDEWRRDWDGPLGSLIESYHTVVLAPGADVVAALGSALGIDAGLDAAGAPERG